MRIELFEANKLNFVEFNFTGDNDGFVRCDSESKYLDTAVFNLFIDCFERTNNLFDYFIPSRYNVRNFLPLIKELELKKAELFKIDNADNLKNYLLNKTFGNQFIQNLKKLDIISDWKEILNKFIKILDDLKLLLQFCLENECTLWIIGY